MKLLQGECECLFQTESEIRVKITDPFLNRLAMMARIVQW